MDVITNKVKHDNAFAANTSKSTMNEAITHDTKLPAAEASGGNALARYLPAVARVLMGLMFFVFGLNGFLHFMPPPKTPMPEVATTFFGALMKTGYMMPLIAGTQVIVGALLLSNRFVPLALALIAPVIVNIVAFHAFLVPTGAQMAGVVLVLELYLAWAYRKAYLPMLAMRVKPGTPKS
jgi:uncharacterized membrane protein YphA (DoxX/SURF4 family)